MIHISVLLDASHIIAFYALDDPNNQRASEITKEISEGVYGSNMISEYVFDETITLLKRYLGHKKASGIGDYLLHSILFLKVDQQIFDDSWILSKKFDQLSFTDCTNIALMKHYGIEYLATFDSGFNGIVKILR